MYCSNASAAKCIDREHIIVVIASVSVLQYISFSMLDILRLLTHNILYHKSLLQYTVLINFVC